MNVFDQAARYAIQIDPIGFIRWLVPGLDPSATFREWLDTRTLPLPGEPDRTCDTVAALARDDDPGTMHALVIEAQSEPDPEMNDRLLEYVARLRRGLRHGPDRRGRYQVAAALVNLTGPAQADRLAMGMPGSDAPGLDFRVALKTLREEDASSTLADIAEGRVAACLLPWISLMKGLDDPSIMGRWKELAGAIPDRRARVEFATLVVVFAELAGTQSSWQKALEGWEMRESTIVAGWKAEGRAEGRAEGMAEGMAEAKRDDLLRVLQLRFPGPVPQDIQAAVEAATDLNLLSRWLEVAVIAASLDDVRAAVRP